MILILKTLTYKLHELKDNKSTTYLAKDQIIGTIVTNIFHYKSLPILQIFPSLLGLYLHTMTLIQAKPIQFNTVQFLKTLTEHDCV